MDQSDSVHGAADQQLRLTGDGFEMRVATRRIAGSERRRAGSALTDAQRARNDAARSVVDVDAQRVGLTTMIESAQAIVFKNRAGAR